MKNKEPKQNIQYPLCTSVIDLLYFGLFVCLLMFNATFNNISVKSRRSVLLVEETDDSEKTTELSQVTDKLYHTMLYTSPRLRFELTTSVVIGTDCIGSCKPNLPFDHGHDGPIYILVR